MDDGIVLSIVAGIFKYKKGEGFNERELSGIADLLCNQKKWVEAYNDANLRTFLRHELCSMVMLSYGGFLHLTKEDGITPEKFDYVFPEEGTLCAIELLCIPKGARNRDGAHKLIDFLISRKTSLANFKVCPGLPANRTALEEIESSGIYRKPTIPSSKIFKKFAFYQNQTSPGVFHEILLRVKNH
jgi:spermidine/putrescine-binding protein